MPGLLTQAFPLHNEYSVEGVKLVTHLRTSYAWALVFRAPTVFGLAVFQRVLRSPNYSLAEGCQDFYRAGR